MLNKGFQQYQLDPIALFIVNRFDERVPVETIEVANPELNRIPLAQQEQISEKVTYRLAQRPGSYVVLKYVRKVIKRTDTHTLHTGAMPINVLEKSVAEVSFLAGMLLDKFLYPLPLYRQHQRLQQNGILVCFTNTNRKYVTMAWQAKRNSPIVQRIANPSSGHFGNGASNNVSGRICCQKIP